MSRSSSPAENRAFTRNPYENIATALAPEADDQRFGVDPLLELAHPPDTAEHRPHDEQDRNGRRNGHRQTPPSVRVGA